MSRRLCTWILLLCCGNLACPGEDASRSKPGDAVRPGTQLTPKASSAPPVAPEEASAAHESADEAKGDEDEDPVVARYRADLKLIEPSISPDRLAKEVARFAAGVEQAKTDPYPKSHAACAAVMKTGTTHNCTLVVGDVVKPKWFEACESAGGAVLESTAPPNTPLHYDGALCTQVFEVGH